MARSNANTFGNVSECSHLVNYVVFVIKVPALGAGKIIGLTASAILTAAYVWVTLHELRSYRTGSHQKDTGHCILSTARPMPSTPSLATVPTVYDYPPPSVISIAAHQNGSRAQVPGAEETVLQMIQKRRPRRRRWSYEVDPMLIGIMICQVMVFTYFIVSSELLISYNDGAYTSANQMGFGQILALIVVLPSALSVIGALKDHGLRRLSKRKKIDVRRKQ